MKRFPRVICVVAAVCSLGFAFVPSVTLLAQDRQDQQVVEPTPQSVDLPPQDTSPALPLAVGAPPPSTDYLIGPEDVLDIDVFNVPELSKTVRVGNDGRISLALLGHVQAAGLTATQLAAQLESKWGQTYLESPQVSVFVKEYHAQPVSVIGAVEKPGLYQLTGPRTLIEMLSMAGGLAKRSSAPAGRTVYVTREEGFADFQPVEGMGLVASDKVEINLQRLLYSREAALNIEIKPLDIISVSKADIVYVVGEVKRAGGFVLEDRERVTVLQALALAEGLTPTAAKRSARIIRTSQDGSRVEIPVNLSRVLKGKSPDVELAANDILFVPTSAGKAAARRGVEAAIATISGVIIWSTR
jgi:polysaccharide export outer membrane protein